MRALPAAAIVVLVTLYQAAPGADEPILIELTVGESKPVGGFRPLCDDPAVAWFDDGGALQGLKPGETICSVSRISAMGPRQAYRVVVRAPPPGEKDRKGGEGRKR